MPRRRAPVAAAQLAGSRPPCVGLCWGRRLAGPRCCGLAACQPPSHVLVVPKFLKIFFKVEGFQNEGRGARGYL